MTDIDFIRDIKVKESPTVKWILLFTIPAALLFLTARTGLLGHVFYYTAGLVTVQVYILAVGALLFNFGPWMKKWIQAMCCITALLTAAASIKYAIAGPVIEPFVIYIEETEEDAPVQCALAALNPNQGLMVITAFPIDAYVLNPALDNMDQLSQLSSKGLSNTAKGLERTINEGLRDMQYYVPAAHYIRAERGIIEQLFNECGYFNAGKIAEKIKESCETDLEKDEITQILRKYAQYKNRIITYEVSGYTDYQYCASSDDYEEVMILNGNEVDFTWRQMSRILRGWSLVQLDMNKEIEEAENAED